MTIQMLRTWGGYEQFSIQNLGATEEARLIAAGLARDYLPGMDSSPSSVSGDGFALSGPSATLESVQTWQQRNAVPPFVHAVSASLTRLGWRLDTGLWAVAEMESRAAGSQTLHYMTRLTKAAYGAATTVSHTGAGIVYTGAGWTTGTQAGTWNGTWRRTATTGNSVTITTPPARHIKISSFRTANMGIGLVTINGDPRAANALTTAQQEVDAGRLPASALTTGGGTIEPDWRVINYYLPIQVNDSEIGIAVNLPLQAHVVQITCAGVKAAAATDFRIGVSSLTTSAQAEGSPDVAQMFPAAMISAIDFGQVSAHEHALGVTIGGQGLQIGNLHAYEAQTALEYWQDGEAITLSAGQMLAGNVSVVRRCDLSHPQAASVGASVLRYTPGARGLTVDMQVNWATTATMGSGYIGMLPIPNWMTQAKFVLDDGTSLVRGGSADDGTQVPAGAAFAALADQVGVVHDSGAMHFDGDRFIAAHRAFFEDRAGGGLNKIYFFYRENVASPEVVSAGRKSVGRYRYIVW